MKEKKEIRPVRCFVCGKKMYYLGERKWEPEYKIYDYGEQVGYVHQKCVRKFKRSNSKTPDMSKLAFVKPYGREY